jgi:hypothetical protein
MRTLVYKRTHKGDPDERGLFGINDCMGKDRDWDFVNVIGVGGIGRQPESQGISGKLNWIGLGATKEPLIGADGPLVRFDHFVLWDDEGQELREIAPRLARHMYSRNVRVMLNFTDTEQQELDRILKTAENAPPSFRGPVPRICRRCSICINTTRLGRK